MIDLVSWKISFNLRHVTPVLILTLSYSYVQHRWTTLAWAWTVTRKYFVTSIPFTLFTNLHGRSLHQPKSLSKHSWQYGLSPCSLNVPLFSCLRQKLHIWKCQNKIQPELSTWFSTSQLTCRQNILGGTSWTWLWYIFRRSVSYTSHTENPSRRGSMSGSRGNLQEVKYGMKFYETCSPSCS